MSRILLLLIPALLSAAPARYARLGDFDGQVEVQLTPSSPWIAAERNLPLPESAWIRTGPSSRVEIELDEGSVWRLGSETQAGLADYARRATGQRVTLLALDRGLAYFTGAAQGEDSLTLIAPGAQVVVTKTVRLRLEAAESASQVAVLQGVARFSSQAAEIDLPQGQTSRVEPANTSRFYLYREVSPIDLDRWSASRDKALALAISGLHVSQRYGLADLDTNGQWVQTDDLGAVWQPKSAEGWTPYRNGRWRWYDSLGYTWVSDDSWGWLPFHYGRWTRHGDLGWVWVPSASTVFKPGEVFWLRGQKFAAWGPLAPAEEWNAPQMPAQYVGANLTFAAFQPEAQAIDPAGFEDRPKEVLRAAAFVSALPSPTFDTARLDASRPLIPLQSLRMTSATQADPPAAPPAPAPKTDRPPHPQVVATPPPPPPQEVMVPVPVVYEGIVILTQPSATPPPPSRRPSPSKTAPPQTVVIPTPLSSRLPARPPRRPDPAEERQARMVLDDLNAARWSKTVSELDDWTKAYPQSRMMATRVFDYVQAYSALARPERALEYASVLLTREWGQSLEEQQIAALLYLTLRNAEAIHAPSSEQRALGASAAQSLLGILPQYFRDDRRPSDSSTQQWALARQHLSAAAQEALQKLAPRPAL